MTTSSRHLLAAVGIVAAVLLAAPPAGAARPTPMERSIVLIINQARISHGLAPLRIAGPLQAGSHSYAGYLLRTGRFEHARNLRRGVRENLAWATTNAGSARAIVRMWLRSPGHRANLFARGIRAIGVGVARGRYQGYPDARVAVARFR